MAIELITGHAGTAHISSADDGAYNAGTAGPGRYVLATANGMAASMPDANTVTIATGDALFDGRHVRITAAESATIDTGTQGQTRHDIVGIAYELSGGIESASIAVYKGVPAASGAVDPDLPSGSILEGATSAFMPLYRIVLTGINAGEPEPLYAGLPTIAGTGEEIEALGAVAAYTHIIVGALGSTNIPLYCRRVGSFVTLFVQAAVNPPSANTTINCGSIPNGYRPAFKAAQGGPSVISGNVSTGVYRWAIETSGAITFVSSATGQRECSLALTYYTTDDWPA